MAHLDRPLARNRAFNLLPRSGRRCSAITARHLGSTSHGQGLLHHVEKLTRSPHWVEDTTNWPWVWLAISGPVTSWNVLVMHMICISSHGMNLLRGFNPDSDANWKGNRGCQPYFYASALLFWLVPRFSRTFLTMFEIMFANWSPPCRVLMENMSEWFSIFFLAYRCVLGCLAALWCALGSFECQIHTRAYTLVDIIPSDWRGAFYEIEMRFVGYSLTWMQMDDIQVSCVSIMLKLCFFSHVCNGQNTGRQWSW